MKRLRAYFAEITASAAKRGTRLRDGDRPNGATFTDLLSSIVFKTEGDDRAKEDDSLIAIADLNGHVVAATDVQAKANQDKKTDRTLVAQPAQLPTVASDETLTISSANTPYTVDTPLEITVDGDIATRNNFLTNFKASFNTWLQTLVTFIDGFYATYLLHVAAYNITAGQVVSNTSAISALVGGDPGNVQIGSVSMWMSTIGTPATYHDLEGGELEQATNSLLFAVLGTQYNTGSETAGYFRLPDMRSRVARGLTGAEVIGTAVGNDSVILTANNMASHNHDGSGMASSLPAPGQGEAGLMRMSIGGEVNTISEDSVNNVFSGIQADLYTQPSGASLDVTGNTGFNSTTNAPVDIIPSALLVKYIIKGE